MHYGKTTANSGKVAESGVREIASDAIGSCLGRAGATTCRRIGVGEISILLQVHNQALSLWITRVHRSSVNTYDYLRNVGVRPDLGL